MSSPFLSSCGKNSMRFWFTVHNKIAKFFHFRWFNLLHHTLTQCDCSAVLKWMWCNSPTQMMALFQVSKLLEELLAVHAEHKHYYYLPKPCTLWVSLYWHLYRCGINAVMSHSHNYRGETYKGPWPVLAMVVALLCQVRSKFSVEGDKAGQGK